MADKKLTVAGLALTACLLLPLQAGAAATFARSLGSNMVLQRDKPLHLWGRAAPGEGVTVTFNSQSVTGVADAGGYWSLALAPMSANASGQTVSLTGLTSSVSLTNVLIGDVWLCTGQSNMEFPLNAPNFWLGNTAATPGGVTEAANANYPEIRVLHLASGASRVSTTPLTDFTVSQVWASAVASNVNFKNYSALGYYYCRDLHTSLGIPIGMIGLAYGGSPAEAWVSLPAIQAEPSLTAVIPVGTPVAGTPHYWPTGISNGSIQPLTPMTIKGVVWDQGESNTNVGVWGGPGLITSTAYPTLFTVLIKDWRARFGEDLPFIFVQMQNTSFLASDPPPVNQSWADNCDAQQTSSNGWSDVRWGEFEALDLTLTAMSVNLTTNANAMYYNAILNNQLAKIYHPPNKEEFAAHLLPWAKNLVYGLGASPYRGPLYRSFQALGGTVELMFDMALATIDGLPARGFMVGDSGGTWAWADSVTLIGSTAIVSAAAIPAPTQVRYAWGDNPADTICAPSQIANLSDAAQRWLASPFQTLQEPVMSVEGNTIYIRDSDLAPQLADGRDFGDVLVAGSAMQVFELKNSGLATLLLSGGASLVRVAGANAADFTVTAQPVSSIAPSSSTNFTVTFVPSAPGARVAVLQIPGNDPNRTPYYIYLKGNGTLPATASPTATETPTATATVTCSPTTTGSTTVTETGTVPPTLTATLSTTSTPTLTPSGIVPTDTPGPMDGPLKISEVQCSPNPNPIAFLLKLAGPADQCRVWVYSSGMKKVAELLSPGRNRPGWLAVPAGTLELANGTYYFSAVAERGTEQSPKSPAGRFMILR